MFLVRWMPLLCLVLAVQASPFSMTVPRIMARENENVRITTGEPARDRIIFVVLALFCMLGIALMLGVYTFFNALCIL
jgi:hypothetical protein